MFTERGYLDVAQILSALEKWAKAECICGNAAVDGAWMHIPFLPSVRLLDPYRPGLPPPDWEPCEACYRWEYFDKQAVDTINILIHKDWLKVEERIE